MKYKWIDEHKERFPVKDLCRVLSVSSSGYYRRLRRPPAQRDIRRAVLATAVKASHARSHEIYGYRKVHEDLIQEMKLECCRETVRRIMREAGLRSKVKHKWVKTTDSNHRYQVAENILDGDFSVDAPNKVWVTDITYIPTEEGWLYLAAVLDLFGRRAVGWSMSKHIDAKLVSDALGMALTQRGVGRDMLHHSDRGSQYCSDMYQELLKRHGIRCSMSRKGNCWDNACMESFFGSLKAEWTKGKRYATREEAKSDIFMYIEMFYNRRRRHATLGYVSPVEYEERHLAGSNAVSDRGNNVA